MSDFKGYPLFDDVDDVEIRRRNQATSMVNMFEEHSRGGKVSAKGLQLIVEYFSKLLPTERASVRAMFTDVLKQRGNTYAS